MALTYKHIEYFISYSLFFFIKDIYSKTGNTNQPSPRNPRLGVGNWNWKSPAKVSVSVKSTFPNCGDLFTISGCTLLGCWVWTLPRPSPGKPKANPMLMRRKIQTCNMKWENTKEKLYMDNGGSLQNCKRQIMPQQYLQSIPCWYSYLVSKDTWKMQ